MLTKDFCILGAIFSLQNIIKVSTEHQTLILSNNITGIQHPHAKIFCNLCGFHYQIYRPCKPVSKLTKIMQLMPFIAKIQHQKLHKPPKKEGTVIKIRKPTCPWLHTIFWVCLFNPRKTSHEHQAKNSWIHQITP